MKHEIGRILNQLDRAWNRDAWHGPAVREVLEGVSAADAARRPIAEAHSIWEIALHIACWEDVICRRSRGETVDPSDEQNFPPVRDRSEAAWAAAREHLERTHRSLVSEIETLEDEQLDEPPPNGKTTRYVQLHGVIQHDLYHAGQIAVLKKAKAKAAAAPRRTKPRTAVARKPAVAARRAKRWTAGKGDGRSKAVGKRGGRPKRRTGA